MVEDAVTEVQRSAAGAGLNPNDGVLNRLRAVEQVLGKVTEAIQLAPPILPNEEDEEEEGEEY